MTTRERLLIEWDQVPTPIKAVFVLVAWLAVLAAVSLEVELCQPARPVPPQAREAAWR